MEVLSLVALILLSLVAYSVGASSQARSAADLKPQIIDLLLVLMIWGGAVYSRISVDINRWLLLLIWISIGFLIGSSVALSRKGPQVQSFKPEKTARPLQGPVIKFWQSWKAFSKKTGSFQSKIILSLFFFLIVTPFALAVKIFSDPLRLKPKEEKSHWLAKKEIHSDLEHFKRQF